MYSIMGAAPYNIAAATDTAAAVAPGSSSGIPSAYISSALIPPSHNIAQYENGGRDIGCTMCVEEIDELCPRMHFMYDVNWHSLCITLNERRLYSLQLLPPYYSVGLVFYATLCDDYTQPVQPVDIINKCLHR